MNLNDLREITTQIPISPQYTSYIVYYSGSIVSSIAEIPQANVIILTPYMAVIFVETGYENLIASIPNVSIVEPPNEYILTQLSPLETSNIIQFTEGKPIDLTGTGVIVGTIDTGIDYLNVEFTREDGTTRILSIWDQTDSSGVPPENIHYGSVYSNEQINAAIKLSKNGGDPYSIVPEKDTNGHGTQCAGIIGARGYNNVKGAAPNCDFIVVKVRPAREFSEISEISSTSIPIYRNTDIATAMLYLLQERSKYQRPIVIFLPMSSNIGGHDGTAAIEELIDYYSFAATVTFALGTGNQGNSETHSSGYINNTGEIVSVQFSVSPNQGNLNISIWCRYPDKISLGITSPSGQVVSRIPAKIRERVDINFLYENTTTKVTYFFPEIISGNELTFLSFSNIAPGIWTVTLFGDYIVNGSFNVWIDQRPLSRPGTALLNPNNFTTLTVPSTSALAITTAFYNQNTNTIGSESGVGFTSTNEIKPEITCGGVNVLTTSLNNTTTTISGSSAATAVLTGSIALLYQWGITDNNLPTMSSQIIKTLLIRGTKKRTNEAYPDPYWGYGTLDMLGVFNAIRGIYNQQDQIAPPITINPKPATLLRKCNDNIDTVFPVNLLGRLKYNK
ncbi:S8 family peptidase [Clostridium sp.]|uniref:S8 family peptidase n=1 Tax=Clostridium sp. TaxID=1506 RepID=UPI0034643B03